MEGPSITPRVDARDGCMSIHFGCNPTPLQTKHKGAARGNSAARDTTCVTQKNRILFSLVCMYFIILHV